MSAIGMILGIPAACVVSAATLEQVPAPVLVAIAHLEGGYPGLVNRNRNGTRDFGAMQINEVWVERLSTSWGWSQDRVRVALRDDACVSVRVGAFILAECVRWAGRRGYAGSEALWHGIGCYASRTDGLRQRYARKVAARLESLYGPTIWATMAP